MACSSQFVLVTHCNISEPVHVNIDSRAQRQLNLDTSICILKITMIKVILQIRFIVDFGITMLDTSKSPTLIKGVTTHTLSPRQNILGTLRDLTSIAEKTTIRSMGCRRGGRLPNLRVLLRR